MTVRGNSRNCIISTTSDLILIACRRMDRRLTPAQVKLLLAKKVQIQISQKLFATWTWNSEGWARNFHGWWLKWTGIWELIGTLSTDIFKNFYEDSRGLNLAFDRVKKFLFCFSVSEGLQRIHSEHTSVWQLISLLVNMDNRRDKAHKSDQTSNDKKGELRLHCYQDLWLIWSYLS